jgi:hypothetical protein
MKTLAPKYRRLAALAILLLVLALPLSALLLLIALYRSNLDDIADRASQISRFTAIARYAPQLDAQHAQSPEATRAAWFLSGGDPAIAAAGLQAKLKELAQVHGVDVAQAHDLKPRLADGITYVGIGFEMSGGAEGIAALLQAIDANVPLLIVKEAEMRAELSGIDPRYDPLVLYLDLEVWGALASPATPQDQADGGS